VAELFDIVGIEGLLRLAGVRAKVAAINKKAQGANSLGLYRARLRAYRINYSGNAA
jgi:hypothetical protein